MYIGSSAPLHAARAARRRLARASPGGAKPAAPRGRPRFAGGRAEQTWADEAPSWAPAGPNRFCMCYPNWMVKGGPGEGTRGIGGRALGQAAASGKGAACLQKPRGIQRKIRGVAPLAPLACFSPLLDVC